MKGRIALITGGTRGIGRTIALRLAHDGAIPALVYRANDAEAERALAEVRAFEPRARIYKTDISQGADVGSLVERIKADLGPVEILVNNAMKSGRVPLKTHEVPLEHWNEDLANNLTSHFLVTRACLPSMIAGEFGRIVFIGSLAMRGERGRVSYCVTKNGLVGLAKTVALEYAKQNVTANVVNPGFIEAGAFLRLPEEMRERARALVPSKRLGKAEHVAGMVAFLCSEDGAYTNGQVIGIDGGAA